MKRQREFFRELARVVLIAAVSGAFGYWLEAPGYGLAAGLLIVIAVWTAQLYRVQRWLEDPTREPPEGYGIWGLLFDNVYLLQRRSREAQGRLESALVYLQDSLASMRDAWMVIDPRGAIAWSNESARHLLGVRFPEDRGRPLLNLLRLPAFSNYFMEEDFSEPLRLPPAQDGERCLQFEVSTFGEGDRLVFVRDITEQFKLESMRRDFVGNVSHELRTPLTVIKGYIETLLDMPSYDGDRVRQPMRQMGEQVSRMESLLKDLLWLSRIESVESHRKTERVEFPLFLTKLVSELRTAYPKRTIELIIDSDGGVYGDAQELHSAVSNLVVNALKYSADDQPVTVEWRASEDHEALRVCDRGVGIEASHIPRLTERFYRVDRSRSQRTGGTGLGLAIVKHVAVSHQAELHINSVPGEGSCFTLEFPKLSAQHND